MAPKYYMMKDDERCHTLDYFRDLIAGEIFEDSAEDGVLLEEMAIEYGEDHFYCSAFGEVAENSDEVCGSINCIHYDPRNGKSGRCRHHKNTYDGTGRWFKYEGGKLIKLNGEAG